MGSPRLDVLVEEWLDAKAVGRGLAGNTEAAYRADLADVCGRLAVVAGADAGGPDIPAAGRVGCADLTGERMRAVFASLARDGLAPSTRGRRVSTWQQFTRWLRETGYLLDDPMAGIERPVVPGRLPVALSVDELGQVLDTVAQPDPQARDPWPSRDLAIVALLAGTGVRAQEATSADVRHLQPVDPPLLRVVGKGNKERAVPVPAEVLGVVEDYLDSREQRLGARAGPDDPLLVNYSGGRLTRGTLNYYVDTWLRRAGVRKPPGEAAHAFRHTYATGLVRNGVAVTAVQQLLGHARLTTTQVYTQVSGAELVQAVQAAEVRGLLARGGG